MLKLISHYHNCPMCCLVKKNPNRLADTTDDWSSPHHVDTCTCLCIPHFACSSCIGGPGISMIRKNNVSTQLLDPVMSTIHRNNVSTQYMLDPGSQALASASVHCPLPTGDGKTGLAMSACCHTATWKLTPRK